MRKLSLYLALIFIFTIPWETAITISSLGTLTRVIGLGSAGVWLLSVLITRKLRKLQAFHLVLFLFMAFNISSIFWTINYDLTFERVKTYLQMAILCWMLWDLISTPESLRLAMQVYIFGGYLAIASAILNFLSGQLISTTELGRYTGAGQNAVEFAVILSMSLPIAWHLASTTNPGPGKVILQICNFAFIPLAIFVITLTASRTALLAIIPGMIYIAFTMGRIKPIYRVFGFTILVVGVFWGQMLVPSATVARLGTIGISFAESDLGGRVALWRETTAIILEHPLLGIGSGSLAAPDQLGTFAHNTFLSVLAEIGFFGFILFAIVLFTVAYKALCQTKPFLLLWISVFIVWVISVFSLTYEYAKPTWYILNIIVISAGINYRESRSVGIMNQELKPVGLPGLTEALPKVNRSS